MKLSLCAVVLTLSAVAAFGQRTEDTVKKPIDTAVTIETLSKAIEADPGSAASYVSRGELLMRTDKCPDALNDFAKAIDIDANFYRAFNDQAFCLGALNRFDESIAAATHSIEIDPAKPDAYLTRGMGFYSSRQYREALADLNQAIELGLNTSDVYARRGNAREATDDWLGALVDHNRAIEMDPGNWKRYAARAVSRRSYGDYVGAIADHNKALELNPQERMQIFHRSWVKLFNNDAAGAYQDTLDYLANPGASNAGEWPIMAGYFALRKMGKADAANQLVKSGLKRAKSGDQGTNILMFLIGELTPDKLIEIAGKDLWQLTDAHSVIGNKALLDGDRRTAELHFKWDQQNGSHETIFHQFARTEYARMTGDPSLLAPPNPRK